MSASTCMPTRRRAIFWHEPSRDSCGATRRHRQCWTRTRVPQIPFLEAGGDRDLMERALHFDQTTYLHDLALKRADGLSMAHSLEVRVPFVDRRIAELAARIPGSMLIRGRVEKYILRRAVSSLLPEDVVWRSKRGFTLRLGRGILDALDHLCDQLLSPASVRQRGFFDPASVEALRRARPGRLKTSMAQRMWSFRICALVLCELWARMFLDRPLASPPPSDLMRSSSTPAAVAPWRPRAKRRRRPRSRVVASARLQPRTPDTGAESSGRRFRRCSAFSGHRPMNWSAEPNHAWLVSWLTPRRVCPSTGSSERGHGYWQRRVPRASGLSGAEQERLQSESARSVPLHGSASATTPLLAHFRFHRRTVPLSSSIGMRCPSSSPVTSSTTPGGASDPSTGTSES